MTAPKPLKHSTRIVQLSARSNCCNWPLWCQALGAALLVAECHRCVCIFIHDTAIVLATMSDCRLSLAGILGTCMVRVLAARVLN